MSSVVELTHIPASEREAEGDREEKQEEEGKGRRKGLGAGGGWDNRGNGWMASQT